MNQRDSVHRRPLALLGNTPNRSVLRIEHQSGRKFRFDAPIDRLQGGLWDQCSLTLLLLRIAAHRLDVHRWCSDGDANTVDSILRGIFEGPILVLDDEQELGDRKMTEQGDDQEARAERPWGLGVLGEDVEGIHDLQFDLRLPCPTRIPPGDGVRGRRLGLGR